MNSKQAKKARALARDIVADRNLSTETLYRQHQRTGTIIVDKQCLRGVYHFLRKQTVFPLTLKEMHDWKEQR